MGQTYLHAPQPSQTSMFLTTALRDNADTNPISAPRGHMYLQNALFTLSERAAVAISIAAVAAGMGTLQTAHAQNAGHPNAQASTPFAAVTKTTNTATPKAKKRSLSFSQWGVVRVAIRSLAPTSPKRSCTVPTGQIHPQKGRGTNTHAASARKPKVTPTG